MAERHELALAEACEAGFYAWWPAEDRVEWSSGLLRVYGLDRAPGAEEGFTRLLHPDDRERVEAETAAYLGSDATRYEHSFRIVRPDGTVRFILDRGTIEREANGTVRVIRGLNIDLTDFPHLDRGAMARQPAAPADAAVLFGSVLAGTPDLVWAKDRAGRITYGNAATYRMLGGGDAARVLGGDAADLVPDAEQARAIEANDAKVLRDGQPMLVEESFTRDGTTRLFQTIKAPLRGADGAIVGIVGISRDVTDQKAAESWLHDRTRQLDLLSRTSARLLLQDGAEERLEEVCADMAGLVGADAYFHFRPVAPDQLGLELAAGLEDGMPEALAVVRFGEMLCGRVAETRTALVVEDLQHAVQPGAEALRAWGGTCYAGFPLVANDRLIGTLAFASRRRTHFRDGELRTLQSICEQIAVALERQRLQRELRDSEARLRLALEAAAAGAWDWHIPSGRIVWSPENYALFDIDPRPDGPTYADWEARLHPEDRAAANEDVAAAVEGRLPELRVEFRVVRRDGSIRWLAGLGRVERAADGSALRMSGINIDITDRKASAAALAEANALLESLFENAPVGIGVWDTGFRFTRLNTALAALNGLPREAHYGRRPDEILPDVAGLDGIYAAWRRILETGEPLRDVEISGATPARPGQTRYWSESFFPVRVGGRNVGIAAIITETTERKRAEAALRESERQLRVALLAARVGAWKAVPATDTFHASERALEIHGLPPGTVLTNKAALATVHPQDRPAVAAAAQRTLATGEPYQVEVRAIHPDGSIVWVASSAERVEDGGTACLVGLIQDITERKRAEVALQAAHDTFRDLVEHSPFGIYVVDADFRLIQVSEGARRIFETVRPLIGRDFDEVLRQLWPDPFATEAIGRFRRTLATGEPYHSPRTVERRADIGTTEAYDWKIERITLPDGRPGVVCHFYDLSERQRHEEHVQLLLHEVNHRSKNMLGLIQAIARHTAATGAADFLQRFGQRVQALSAAQDLLIQNDWRSVPLGALVRAQLAHFADLIDTRITLAGPGLALTPAAAQALGLAVHELGTNASKHGALSTGAGRVAIEWRVAAGAAGEAEFAITWVERDGPAVAAPQRRGFGSTLTTGMAEASVGGTVTVDYAPDGFAWRLACPAANVMDARAHAPRLGAPAAALPEDQEGARGRLRVLVVEDEPLIAGEMAAMLGEAGYDVVGPAGSLRAGLALLERQGCDAAVLDVTLGTETSEPLARLLLGRGTPFVVVSGYTRAQLPALFRSAPLLGKPMQPAELERALSLCLAPADGRR
jgi:PAS domain S-box-containing protein